MPGGRHAFISYVREDADRVRELRALLQAAGVRVWRDTVELLPGQDWRMVIRHAISSGSLVFLACFSQNSTSREKSFQNEELMLAVEQMRLRRPGEPWLIPVRFDDCPIPDHDIGAGRTLASIQRADLFGERHDQEASRLIASVQRILAMRTGTNVRPAGRTWPGAAGREWLREYLHAAVSAAGKHPYAGMLPDRTPPSLSAVYVRQYAWQPAEVAGSPAFPSPVAADSIFDQDADCLLYGGPGAGKTSLLRMAVKSLALSVGSSAEGALVPVYVPASGLVSRDRSFPDALADAVSTDLFRCGLLNRVPAEAFRHQPAPGCRWLVLIDGLDEIASAVQRTDLLATLTQIQQHSSDALPIYRFVIASRLMSAKESEHLRQGQFRCYELLPFEVSQLETFAADWFRASGLPQAAALARGVVTQIERVGLLELARLPLMATMICQLFAASPGKRLAQGRFGVYEDFTDLARQHAITSSRLLPADPDLIPEQAAAAAGLPEWLFDQLPHLAVAVSEGDAPSAREFIADRAAELRPPHMPRHLWLEQVLRSLRRGGLVNEMGDDFAFVHQTLAEFLAARHIAFHDEHRSRRLYRAIFGEHGTSTPGPGQLTSFNWFLISAWQANPATRARLAQTLSHIAGRAELHSAVFIADAAAEGIPLDHAVTRSACRSLDALSADPGPHIGDRIKAAIALGALDSQVGGDRLIALSDDRQFDGHSRASAARALADLRDPRAADILAALAATPLSNIHFDRLDDGGSPYDYNANAPQLQAVRELRRLGDPRERDALYAIARNPRAKSFIRLEAARMLSRDPGYADLLADLASGQAFGFEGPRIAAALDLAAIGDPRGQQALIVLADPDAAACVPAAKELASTGYPGSADLLAALSTRSRQRSDRLEAATTLADLGDPRGIDALTALAADPAAHHSTQSRYGHRGASVTNELASPGAKAVMALGNLSDPRLDDVLAEIAAGSVEAAADLTRAEAAQFLARRGDPRGTDALLALARPSSTACVETATMLARLRHPSASDILTSLAAEPSLCSDDRLEAAIALVDLGDTTCADALVAIATDPTAHEGFEDTWQEERPGYKAIRALGRLDASPYTDILQEIATGSATYATGLARAEAAKVLASLTPKPSYATDDDGLT